LLAILLGCVTIKFFTNKNNLKKSKYLLFIHSIKMTRPYPSKRKFTLKKSSKKSRKKTPVEPLVLKKLKMVLQKLMILIRKRGCRTII
jgi:hypothetical protein